MERAFGLSVALAVLAGCGVQGDPVAPGGGPVMDASVGVGPAGPVPVVRVSEGIGRVSLGPGGVRVGAAGIPLGLIR